MFYGQDLSGLWVFEIMASIPPKEGQTYKTNVTVHVITDGAPRAMQIFYENYPGGEIHKLERRNRTNNVLIDPHCIRQG